MLECYAKTLSRTSLALRIWQKWTRLPWSLCTRRSGTSRASRKGSNSRTRLRKKCSGQLAGTRCCNRRRSRFLAGSSSEMHKQKEAPKRKRGGVELGERSCTNSQASQVGTFKKSSRGATEIFMIRSGLRCKHKEHSRLLDIAVTYQHSVVHPGTQHAWDEHNEHRTPMMLFWQADRFHFESIEDLAVVYNNATARELESGTAAIV